MLRASSLSLLLSIFIPQSPFLPIWASCHEKCTRARADCQLSFADRQLSWGCPPPPDQTSSWVPSWLTQSHHRWVDLYALAWPDLVWPGEVCKASQNGANPAASSKRAVIFLCFRESSDSPQHQNQYKIHVYKTKKRRFAKLHSLVCRRGRGSSKGLHWREGKCHLERAASSWQSLVEQRLIFKSCLGNWTVWGRPVLGRQWHGNEGEETLAGIWCTDRRISIPLLSTIAPLHVISVQQVTSFALCTVMLSSGLDFLLLRSEHRWGILTGSGHLSLISVTAYCFI